MINRFPGPCAICKATVLVGGGVWDGKLHHAECTAPLAPTLPRPFSITRCVSVNAFEVEVNAQTDLFELNHIRDLINQMNQRNEKHVLNHPERGFRAAYGILNKRAEALGFKPYSGGYYKPQT